MRRLVVCFLLSSACDEREPADAPGRAPVLSEAAAMMGLRVGARWTYLRSGDQLRWKEITGCEEVQVIGPDGERTVRAYVRENRNGAGLTSVHYLVVDADGVQRVRRDDIERRGLDVITTYLPASPRLQDGPYRQGDEWHFALSVSEVEPHTGLVRGSSPVEATDAVLGNDALDVIAGSFETVAVERAWTVGEPHVVRSFYAAGTGEVLEETWWPGATWQMEVEELVSHGPGYGLCDGPLDGATCTEPQRTCDDAWGAGFAGCTDPRVDAHNCGVCGVVCESGVCAGGVCQEPACDLACGGATLCCPDAWGWGLPGCTSPGRDALNCGGCGVVCRDGQICRQGSCECAPGTADCRGDGGCIDVLTDPDNCGACGNQCPEEAARCDKGVCVASCASVELEDCGAECLDLDWDIDNCGACGERCGPGTGTSHCSQGECVTCSQVGMTDCDGTCEDVAWSDGNCGACGQACAGGEVCVLGDCVGGDGTCTMDCDGDRICCGGECFDPRTSDTHCGGCNVDRCGGGCTEACRDGECAAVVCGDGGDD